MPDVFKTPYEIVGEGIPIAEAFYAERDAAASEVWKLVEALGADGYRPGWGGTIRSLLFKELPANYRQIGRDKDRVECVPHKGTKAGKNLAKVISGAVRIPDEQKLADAFGWEGRSPCDGTRIYWATVTRMELPSVRYLMRLPRTTDDGFVPPATLIEIKQSEYAKAFEDHNEAARASNKETAN